MQPRWGWGIYWGAQPWADGCNPVGIEEGGRGFISQCAGDGLVQQRLRPRLQRGVLPPVEAREALGFFRHPCCCSGYPSPCSLRGCAAGSAEWLCFFKDALSCKAVASKPSSSGGVAGRRFGARHELMNESSIGGSNARLNGSGGSLAEVEGPNGLPGRARRRVFLVHAAWED